VPVVFFHTTCILSHSANALDHPRARARPADGSDASLALWPVAADRGARVRGRPRRARRAVAMAATTMAIVSAAPRARRRGYASASTASSRSSSSSFGAKVAARSLAIGGRRGARARARMDGDAVEDDEEDGGGGDAARRRRVLSTSSSSSSSSSVSRRDTVAQHFVNLKNGVEALPTLRRMGVSSFTYIRIQSSLLEAGNVEKMVLELDSSLLLALALGRSCFVWDYGSRDVNPLKSNGNSRALWYGAEFVRYATRKEWFGNTSVPPVLRGKNVERDFATKLTMLSRGAKRKLRYYRQFIPDDVDDVRLLGVYKATTHDDDNEFYRNVLHAEEFGARRAERDPSGVVGDVDEATTIRAIKELGFNIFYSGAEEPVWLNQLRGNSTSDSDSDSDSGM